MTKNHSNGLWNELFGFSILENRMVVRPAMAVVIFLIPSVPGASFQFCLENDIPKFNRFIRLPLRNKILIDFGDFHEPPMPLSHEKKNYTTI